MIDHSAFAEFGYFNPALVHLCDWEYFARISVNRGLRYVDELSCFSEFIAKRKARSIGRAEVMAVNFSVS